MDREVLQITEKVAAYISDGEKTGRPGDPFEDLALEVFQFQYKSIEPYRRLCQRRGKTPETVDSWREIPAVPADAFKHFALFAGEPGEIEHTFRSSGTTDPRNSSKSHFSGVGLELMRTAITRNAARMLFPDGKRTRLLVLAPGPEIAPHMIMVRGMNHMIEQFGAEGSRFCIGPQGLDMKSILSELQQCESNRIPVTLMGSSFGFVHLFDAMEEMKIRLELPEGSRLMDAGGYKGRSRELARAEFVEWTCSLLGLPPDRVVNLLGMTELASQIYDGVLDRSVRGANNNIPRMKEPPHWVRTRIVDPTEIETGDLRPIKESNRPGLLRHLDLANVERPMMIQSEDIAVWREGEEEAGFEILRRVKGAEPRGCSLSVEDFDKSRAQN